MYIERITLEKFRGAEELPITLDRKLNVFVGMNGSGKSSILDATAILLSWLANRIKSINSSGRPITETDINNTSTHANLDIEIVNCGHKFKWNISKTRRGYSKKDSSSNLASASELARHIQMLNTNSNFNNNIPLFAYYPVNRAVLDIPLRIRAKHKFDLLSAYDDSLTSGANFRTFFEWFREREDLENENLKYKNDIFKPEGFEYPDSQLETVRNALNIFMPDFTNLTVRRNPLRMEVEKNGKTLQVNQLSDGEKCLMAIVGDIARRLAIANPKLKNPLEGEGIILIDEIDLHLHPKWQRVVVSQLNNVFKNCQFIISTHSPHVVTHVKKENLFLISSKGNDLKVIKPQESYGKTIERILEDIMGLETTRPEAVNSSIRKIYDQIHLNELKLALDLINDLENEIGSDPELAKARSLIKRKEFINK